MKRRRVLLARRAERVACLLAPSAVVVGTDLLQRGARLARLPARDLGLYALIALGSIAFWTVLLHWAAVRRGRLRWLGVVVFAVLFTFAFAVQNAFFGIYRVYAAIDSLIFGDSFFGAIVASLPFDRPPTALAFVVGLALAVVLLLWAQRAVRPRGRARRYAPLAAAAVLIGGFSLPVSGVHPNQLGTPDLLYFHGLAVHSNAWLRGWLRGKPLLVRVQRRTPQQVPPLLATPPAKRNLLLVLQEAQRADVTCIAYDARCQLATRATNALAPGRLPFHQVRAVASSTAVSIAVLWSGLDPTSSSERLHSAPLIWEYARAAGYDTAYWTSQHTMFGNCRLFVQDIPTTAFASGTQLDPTCHWLTGADDAQLADRVLADLPRLTEPFFAVVQLSNIHRPRVLDLDDLPFQPTHREDHGVGGVEGRNHYNNAVYASDKAVARLIQGLRATPAGARTVLVYTSDHGEAFGEHENENDHSATVYDEEIHVPLWIDAPSGTLSADEVFRYRAARNEYLTHYHLAATLVDLLGLWTDAAFAPFRAHYLGTPIARPRRGPLAAPLTNTSWVWEYHRPNWGLMLGSLKVLAQPEDQQYLCFDVRSDPAERRPLHSPACDALIGRADRTFGMLPKDMKRLRRAPGWGARAE